MLLAIFASALAFVAGGAVGRLHGGWRPWPDTVIGRHAKFIARVAYGVLVTAPLWWLVPWYLALAAMLACGAARALPHGSGLNVGVGRGRDPDELWRTFWAPADDLLDDSVFNAAVGALRTLAIGLVLVPAAIAGSVGPAWCALGLAGAVRAPAYWLKPVIGDGQLDLGWAPRPIDEGRELAEALDVALAAALVQLLWLPVVAAG